MYGRTVFTASGLSDAGTVAHAWALDAAQSFNEQTIAAAAAMVCSLKDCAASSAQAWATVPASDRPDAVKTVRPYMPGQYERDASPAAISDDSDAGTVAHAWALDAAQSFNEQTIAAAAAALGVAGTPVL